MVLVNIVIVGVVLVLAVEFGGDDIQYNGMCGLVMVDMAFPVSVLIMVVGMNSV